jgi:5-hydroxyisourate hydrolase-like protein (transthyretin family)
LIARLVFAWVMVFVAAAQPIQSPKPTQAPTGYRIAGVVVDSVTGQPVAGVTVAITPTDDRQSSQTTETHADGRFAFAGLRTDKYSLTTASTRGYRAQGFNQHGNYFTGIAVGPNLNAESLVFRLVPDASIVGIVTDDDSEPVRNANVQLFQRNNDTGRLRTQQVFNAVSDDRGHYQFGHLAPGVYFVAVSARPWYAQYPGSGEAQPDAENAARVAEERAQLDIAYPLTFYPAAEDSSGASQIVLHPGERVTADVALKAVPAVHLRINTGEGSEKNSGDDGFHGFPRVSQRIFEGYLTPIMAAQGFGYTAGVYEYTGIAPGRYVIEMPSPGSSVRRRYGAGWYKEIDLAGTVELTASENPPLASVTGVLGLEGGVRPGGKMFVVLTNRTSRENFMAEVSAKGLFDFKDNEIRPGTYDVQLGNAPGFQVKSLLAKGARAAGQTLEIGGSGSVQMVCTVTRAVSRVTGVVMRDDKPYAGAMVVLVPRDPNTNWALFRRDQSDSDGTFALPELIPGSYTVIALENGWDLDWASPAVLQPFLKNGTPVEVTGEGTITVKVQLQ